MKFPLTQLPLSLSLLSPPTLPPSRASYPSYPIPISSLFDNVAAGPSAGNFDGRGGSFPIEFLPTGDWVWDGVHYALPPSWGERPDNVVCWDQRLDLDGLGYVRELHMLYSGDWIDGETTGTFELGFEDGSTESVRLSVKNWWTLHWLNEGVIKAPYHHVGPDDVSYNLTQIHQFSVTLPTRFPVQSLKLPSWSWNRVHLFALSYTPALSPSQPSEDIQDLIVRRARLTSKTQTFSPFAPLLEITLASLARSVPHARFPLTAPHTLHLRSNHFSEVSPTPIYRLAPSDEARLLVPVLWLDEERDRYETLLPVEMWLRDEEGREKGRWMVSVERRFDREVETPLWFDDAKFGIFVHWGIYSVPAWAPSGEYAAWYQWWLHNPADERSETWRYHRDTYGEDFVYDQFIANFTASRFNATEWIDLFQSAGAKYFVIVTKHHEGFALFDTKNTSHRSSVHLGPKRDFVRELMDAATATDLRKGTYITMPEWFNPDYQKYGFDRFPGGLAMHPFQADRYENYTGRLEIADYLWDLQLAQMRMLAQEYGTEIMWCDIGGPNLTHVFAPEFYAQAKREGRQVTMNNRCGSHASFDTPELSRFASIQRRKWESSEGIDPRTYGLNRRTAWKDYRSTETIIHTLVDIVSKNGNYLLNVGPDREGWIIDPMRDRLIETGKWLAHSGECVYDTTYSSMGAEYGSLRFTTTPTTFCIISLDRPRDGTLVVPAARQIPILENDTITLLGAEDGTVGWERDSEGGVVLHFNDSMVDIVQHAWAFKISYVWDSKL